MVWINFVNQLLSGGSAFQKTWSERLKLYPFQPLFTVYLYSSHRIQDEEHSTLSTRLRTLAEPAHPHTSRQRHVGFTLPSPKLTRFFSQLMYSPKTRRHVLRDEEEFEGLEEEELCVGGASGACVLRETSTDTWQLTGKLLCIYIYFKNGTMKQNLC